MVELNDLSTIKSNEMLMFNVRYVTECVPSRDTDLFFILLDSQFGVSVCHRANYICSGRHDNISALNVDAFV